MNILLTGAGGFIGRHILQFLEQQGHHLAACSRSPEKIQAISSQCSVLHSDFTDMTEASAWLPHLKNIDVVINCVGIIAESKGQSFLSLHAEAPMALFKAAEQVGVKKVIQISALGADESAKSAYHLSKKAADDVLRTLSLDWYVIQPSVVYGSGAQSMALFHALAALPVLTLIDGGNQLLQPVHVSDLVATVTLCLKQQSHARVTIPVVGPDVISFKALMRRLRQRLGKKPAIEISVSKKTAKRFSLFGKWMAEPVFTPENIEMLARGNTAPTDEISRFLGRLPQSPAQVLWRLPANQAERWHAALYFLRPVLRLSIAFLWVWSGWVSIFLFPNELSYQFLVASGIDGIAAPIMLYGLAIMDIALGLATLTVSKIRGLMFFQIIIVLLYTVTISFTLPEFWLHPFGPVLKNIPLLVTLIVYMILDGEKP